ncbi:MAG: YaaL family protein [Lachnospiraceae bacterium]|nr:YaaL family protein [Lachnospiraceae bacterium]
MPETKDNLMEDLKKTRFALEVAYSGFDNVTDPDLIDCYIYQVNSIWKRYSYLMEKISRS